MSEQIYGISLIEEIGENRNIANHNNISDEKWQDVCKVLEGKLSSKEVQSLEYALDESSTINEMFANEKEEDSVFMGGLPNDGGLIDAEMNDVLEKLSEARLQITTEEMEVIKSIVNKYR